MSCTKSLDCPWLHLYMFSYGQMRSIYTKCNICICFRNKKTVYPNFLHKWVTDIPLTERHKLKDGHLSTSLRFFSLHVGKGSSDRRPLSCCHLSHYISLYLGLNPHLPVPGLVFTKGLRLSPVLALNVSIKLRFLYRLIFVLNPYSQAESLVIGI